MPIQVLDANSNVQGAPMWIDPVYKFSGVVLATNTAAAKDLILITGAPSGTVTRLVSARFRLLGGGTASTEGAGVSITMNRVTAAPTGQSNTLVAGYGHDPAAAAYGSTVNLTPQGSQTAGTLAKQLAGDVFSIFSSGAYASTVDAATPMMDFFCGPSALQQPVIIGAGLFLTFRAAQACPSASILYFDIALTEATS